MTPTERELTAPPCQCSYRHLGYCDETCPDDREHDSWCSQAGRPVDRSRQEANDRIAVALGLNAGIGAPFITDAIVRKLTTATEYADGTTAESMGVDDVYAIALAYVEANPA